MASAYTILHNYSQELYTPNLELINTALQSKQGMLNANRMKLQSMYNQLGFLDIAKDGDKEYTEQRLQSAKSIVDQYANLDLSSNNLTDGLVNKLTETVDETVQTAVVSTARMRSEQRAWEKLRTDSPKLYSQTNRNYANQATTAWLQDETVGKKYNGGGGVIEYRDLGKKILDNLPDLQKSLHAEWIETGPQQGFFRSIDTKEAVSRSKMQEALGFLFDDGDRQQMNIDAWSRYDGVSDEALKQAYDSYQKPKIEEADERIAAYKIAKGKVSSAEAKAQYDKAIEGWTNQRDSLVNNSFEAVYQANGREAVYTTLYRNGYNDSILDTYSYGPRTIETKVDAIHKANVEHEFALKQHKDDMAVKSAELQLKADEVSESNLPTRTEQVAKPSEGAEMTDFIEREQGRRTEAITGAKSMLQNYNLPESTLQSPEFLAQIESLAGKTHIIVKNAKGEDVKIDVAKYHDVLVDYDYRAAHTSPTQNRQIDGIRTMLASVEKRLRVAAEYGFSLDLFKETPNFNFKLVQEGGKMKYKYLPNDNKTNNYAYLIKNGAKTEAGKLTLEIYKGLHLMNDGGISKSERRLARDYVNSLLAELPADTRKNINTKDFVITPGKRLKNSHSVVSKYRDFWLTEFTKGDTEYLPQIAGDDLMGNKRDYYSRVTKERADIGIKEYGENEGLDFIIADGFESINRQSSDVYAAVEEGQESSYAYTYDSGDVGYEALKKLAGISGATFKDDITIRKRWKANGEDTGEILINYKVKNTAAVRNETGEVYQDVPKVVSRKELIQAGVVGAFDDDRYTYNAAHGENARTINLGNYTFSEDHPINTNEGIGSRTMFTDEAIAQEATRVKEAYGQGAKRYLYALDLFEKGEYDFKLVPSSSGMYSVEIKLGGVTKGVFETQKSKFTEKDRYNIDLDPRPVIENAFSSYLDKIEASASKDIAKKL